MADLDFNSSQVLDALVLKFGVTVNFPLRVVGTFSNSYGEPYCASNPLSYYIFFVFSHATPQLEGFQPLTSLVHLLLVFRQAAHGRESGTADGTGQFHGHSAGPCPPCPA